MAPLSNTRITSDRPEAFSRERIPEVASLLSRATTNSQWVPAIGVAIKVFSTPANVPSIAAPFFRSFKSTFLMASENGFIV
ncbi:hypothetical protein D3C86_1766320 [compost metagenome]